MGGWRGGSETPVARVSSSHWIGMVHVRQNGTSPTLEGSLLLPLHGRNDDPWWRFSHRPVPAQGGPRVCHLLEDRTRVSANENEILCAMVSLLSAGV